MGSRDVNALIIYGQTELFSKGLQIASCVWRDGVLGDDHHLVCAVAAGPIGILEELADCLSDAGAKAGVGFYFVVGVASTIADDEVNAGSSASVIFGADVASSEVVGEGFVKGGLDGVVTQIDLSGCGG